MASNALVQGAGTSSRDEVRDIARVAAFLGFVVVAALILNVLYAVWAVGMRFGGCLGWALALGLVGMMVGFLFGIPRVLQHRDSVSVDRDQVLANGESGATGEDRRYEQRVNTNLEEISDWLTKIIVGIGLVELKQVPACIVAVANTIAPSLGEETAGNQSAAAAMAVFYPVAGFLFGYLVTRLYVQGAFARADVDATRYALHADVDVRVAALEAGQKLAFSGSTWSAGPVESGGVAIATAPSPGDAKKGLEELARLGREYMGLNIADYTERVQKKNELGQAMYSVARNCQIPKRDLARAGNEPLLLALALAVIASPEAGDLALLLDATSSVTRLHVKYHVVLALASLCRASRIAANDRPRVLELLERYRRGADDSLLHQIKGVELLIGGA